MTPDLKSGGLMGISCRMSCFCPLNHRGYFGVKFILEGGLIGVAFDEPKLAALPSVALPILYLGRREHPAGDR